MDRLEKLDEKDKPSNNTTDSNKDNKIDDTTDAKIETKKENNDNNLDDHLKDFQNSKLYKKLIELFDEYLLTELQRLAAFKFIKDKFSNTDCVDAENLKKWILLKMNNKIQPDNIHVRQRGCIDIVPGLRIQAWWDPKEFPWIITLIENIKIIQEELNILRDNTGFQPYKSPKYVSNIEVYIFIYSKEYR